MYACGNIALSSLRPRLRYCLCSTFALLPTITPHHRRATALLLAVGNSSTCMHPFVLAAGQPRSAVTVVRVLKTHISF